MSVRYLTKRFHSKLYIFGRVCAFVGSSNLTAHGLELNDEINVKIPADDLRFEELQNTFESYWDSAEPLTAEGCDIYRSIENRFGLEQVEKGYVAEILNTFGIKTVEGNILGHSKQKDAYREKIERMIKKYQVFLRKFDTLRTIYVETGRRKTLETELPLNLEIDQF